MKERFGQYIQWLTRFEGSTRAVGLMRIGLVFLLWSRWASDMRLLHADELGTVLVGLSFSLSTLFMLVGFFTRVSMVWAAITLGVIYYYLGFQTGIEPYTHHHTYFLFIATALLAFTPAGKSFSVDRWLAVRRAKKLRTASPVESAPLWAVRLIALQVSMIYFWGAYDKCGAAFLSGERLEHIVMYLYIGSDYPTWPFFYELMLVVAIGTVSLEFILAFGLWVRSWHRWLIPVGIAFHLVIYYTLPVMTYSLTMCLLYLSFIDPQKVHDTIDIIVED